MATKKQPKSKNGRTGLNMTVVVVTSESVLLFLLAAKRFIVSARQKINLIGSG